MIIFFIFQHGEQFVFTVPDRLYMFANHAHAIGTQNTAGEKKRRRKGKKNEGGYIDEARGLLFSWLISLNLLIPILKLATFWLLLCAAPSQIKRGFIPVPF